MSELLFVVATHYGAAKQYASLDRSNLREFVYIWSVDRMRELGCKEIIVFGKPADIDGIDEILKYAMENTISVKYV